MELLLFLFVISIVFGVVVLYSFFKKVYHIVMRTQNQRHTSRKDNGDTYDKSSKQQKIFGQNEGRYIQYEEVKE